MSSASSINGWCIISLSPAQSHSRKTTKPTFFANSKFNSSSLAPPALIRNQPVFAAPAPIINHTWRDQDMAYEEAIAGLKKLLREKSELEAEAAEKVSQITAQLQTTSGSSSISSPAVDRMKQGFIHFKKEKYEGVLICIEGGSGPEACVVKIGLEKEENGCFLPEHPPGWRPHPPGCGQILLPNPGGFAPQPSLLFVLKLCFFCLFTGPGDA